MKKRLDVILEYVLTFLLSVMLLAVLWQVFSRYLLKEPSSYTEELARYTLIWIGTLGAAYASGLKLHLAITILPEKLSLKNQRRLQVLLNFLIVTFSLTVFCIGGIRLVYITNHLGQQSPALGVPLFYIYSIIPVSGLIIIFYKALDTFELITGRG